MYNLCKTYFFLLIIACFFCFVACEDNPLGGDTEIQTALDHSFAQSEFGVIQSTFDIEAQLNDDLNNKTTQTNGFLCSCSNIVVVENSDGTYTMEVDYGAGCICLDGRRRAGKLIGIFNGKWNVDGAFVDITSDGYQVTGFDGTSYDFSFNKRITRVNAQNYSVEVNNAVLSSADGSISWNSNRTIEWVAGTDDMNPETNEYLIRGSASGTAITGVNFTVTIDEPLKILATCPNIVSGVITLTPQGGADRLIDYGNGTCDATANVTISGFSRTIQLR